MSVHDAEPGDIYADANGKLWRITGICHEPTVEAEEVEGTLHDPNALPLQGALAAQFPLGARATINKRRLTGGTGGVTWRGWERIFRHKRK